MSCKTESTPVPPRPFSVACCRGLTPFPVGCCLLAVVGGLRLIRLAVACWQLPVVGGLRLFLLPVVGGLRLFLLPVGSWLLSGAVSS
jgi:hypothetical protein